MSELQIIYTALRDQDLMLLLVVILGAVVFWFVRRAWLLFVKEMERTRAQVNVIHRLQLELAEVSEIDLEQYKDITSHADILRRIEELHAAQLGEKRLSRTDLFEFLARFKSDLEMKLNTWLEALQQKCNIVDCPHKANMEIMLHDIERSLKTFEVNTIQIAKDNKELGDEFIAFAGALLDVVAGRTTKKTR